MNQKPNFKEMPWLKCENCQSLSFQSITVAKKVSKFYTQTGQNEILPIELLACTKCGKVPEDLLPPGLTTDLQIAPEIIIN